MSKTTKLDLIMKQRAVIDFCVCLEKSSMETNNFIQQAYGMEAMTRSKVFKWCKELCDRQTTIEHAKGSGCPCTVRIKIMVNMLVTLIHIDHLLTVRQFIWIMDRYISRECLFHADWRFENVTHISCVGVSPFDMWTASEMDWCVLYLVPGNECCTNTAHSSNVS